METTRFAVHSHYYPPLDHSPSATATLVQITCLLDSYMIWVGTTDEIPGAERESEPSKPTQAPISALSDSTENDELEAAQSTSADARVLAAISNGRVARDWACAMPPLNVRTVSPELIKSQFGLLALGSRICWAVQHACSRNVALQIKRLG